MSFVARLQRAWRPIGSVDGITNSRIVGWAMGSGKVTVEAWLGEKRVASATPGIVRDDVAVAFPRKTGAAMSGFSLDLPAGAVDAQSLAELRVIVRPRAPWVPPGLLATFLLAGSGLEADLARAPEANLPSPFPRAITNMVASRWPDDCSDLLSIHGQRSFARRLKQLFQTPAINALPAIADYARYLEITLSHCRFVEKHFPVTNPRASAGSADFHCKPNSVRELFPIINHLYVLKSYGVEGDFAEFGCFKGYSSAMLSFACERLGLKMHIFDSFEGLPPAAGSGYEPGQYAGGLDEVRDHVERFGSLGAVEFHKGFFADTFRDWRPPALMCMWVDVDLELSARDLMVVADRLDPRGGVFSHECQASIFRNGDIVSPAHPDNPIAPMLARFEEMERPLTGHYVAGYTGAFWPRNGGIPVLDTDVLFGLVAT